MLLITYYISGAIAASGYYLDYNWPFHIIDLNCTGEEDSIWNCSYNELMEYNCPSSHDASLQCQGNYIFLILHYMNGNMITMFTGIDVVIL